MAGAFRTRQDLVTEALANIGVLAAGQPVDPEDYNYVDEKLDAIMRMLSALQVVTITDLNNIRGEFFSPLADIVAGECCTKFGSTSDDVVMLVNKGLGGVQGIDRGNGAAAKDLRAMNRGFPTGEILQSDFF